MNFFDLWALWAWFTHRDFGLDVSNRAIRIMDRVILNR